MGVRRRRRDGEGGRESKGEIGRKIWEGRDRKGEIGRRDRDGEIGMER